MTNEPICTVCGENPGSPVRIDLQVAILCSSCLGEQTRRRLSWRRLVAAMALSVVVAPVIVLEVGVFARSVAAARDQTMPNAPASAGSLLLEGWRHVSSLAAGDGPDLLGVIATIAVAAAISLASALSAGRTILDRQAENGILDLDGYMRLVRLDAVAVIYSGTVLMAASCVLLFVADTILDAGDGWALVALFASALWVWLLTEVLRISGLAGFADRARLHVSSGTAHWLHPRRAYARRLRPLRGCLSLVAFFAVVVVACALAFLPDWRGMLRAVLSVAGVSACAFVVLAVLSIGFLREKGTANAFVSAFFGVALAAIAANVMFGVAQEEGALAANGWRVLAAQLCLVVLYAFAALGFAGLSGARPLSVFTLMAERAGSRGCRAVSLLRRRIPDWARMLRHRERREADPGTDG